MKLLFDFFPVLFFFLVYKFYTFIPANIIHSLSAILPLTLHPGQEGSAIYLATAIAIIASFIQVLSYWLLHKKFAMMHVISLILISIFGGATLYLHDATFIKWKPTILNWVFGTIFILSHWISDKPMTQQIMAHAIEIPNNIWRKLNLAWSSFFFASGALNLYVAYRCSQSMWVDFKMFGLLGLTILFVLGQGFYLARFIDVVDN